MGDKFELKISSGVGPGLNSLCVNTRYENYPRKDSSNPKIFWNDAPHKDVGPIVHYRLYSCVANTN